MHERVHRVDFAAMRGHAAVVKQLLLAGADFNAVNYFGYTALLFAAKNGHSMVVNHLLRAGANVNHENGNEETALLLAA